MLFLLFSLISAVSGNFLLLETTLTASQTDPPSDEKSKGSINFTKTQKLIIGLTASICGVLIIVGAILTCYFRKKNTKNFSSIGIEQVMLPSPDTPFGVDNI